MFKVFDKRFKDLGKGADLSANKMRRFTKEVEKMGDVTGVATRKTKDATSGLGKMTQGLGDLIRKLNSTSLELHDQAKEHIRGTTLMGRSTSDLGALQKETARSAMEMQKTTGMAYKEAMEFQTGLSDSLNRLTGESMEYRSSVQLFSDIFPKIKEHAKTSGVALQEFIEKTVEPPPAGLGTHVGQMLEDEFGVKIPDIGKKVSDMAKSFATDFDQIVDNFEEGPGVAAGKFGEKFKDGITAMAEKAGIPVEKIFSSEVAEALEAEGKEIAEWGKKQGLRLREMVEAAEPTNEQAAAYAKDAKHSYQTMAGHMHKAYDISAQTFAQMQSTMVRVGMGFREMEDNVLGTVAGLQEYGLSGEDAAEILESKMTRVYGMEESRRGEYMESLLRSATWFKQGASEFSEYAASLNEDEGEAQINQLATMAGMANMDPEKVFSMYEKMTTGTVEEQAVANQQWVDLEKSLSENLSQSVSTDGRSYMQGRHLVNSGNATEGQASTTFIQRNAMMMVNESLGLKFKNSDEIAARNMHEGPGPVGTRRSESDMNNIYSAHRNKDEVAEVAAGVNRKTDEHAQSAQAAIEAAKYDLLKDHLDGISYAIGGLTPILDEATRVFDTVSFLSGIAAENIFGMGSRALVAAGALWLFKEGLEKVTSLFDVIAGTKKKIDDDVNLFKSGFNSLLGRGPKNEAITPEEVQQHREKLEARRAEREATASVEDTLKNNSQSGLRDIQEESMGKAPEIAAARERSKTNSLLSQAVSALGRGRIGSIDLMAVTPA